MEDNKINMQDSNLEENTLNDSATIENQEYPENNEQVSEIDRLKAELEEQKDKYLRLFAEFDNFKRRSAKERIELIQTAGKEVITSLLDVLDDSERAEKQLQTSE